VGVGGQGLDAAEKLGGQVVDLQPEEILDLGEEDDHSDAVGEADDDCDRDEADQLPHASQAHGEQEDAGEHGGAHQVGKAVDGDDAVDDGNEGAGRAADLHPGAAKSEVSKPAMMAVQMPAAGEQPEAMAKAMARAGPVRPR
jgi:hypothetical protein